MVKPEEIAGLKKRIVDAGCPLGDWGMSSRLANCSSGRVTLDQVGNDTKCGQFRKEIREIGEFEDKRFKELRYDGVPAGFVFITNASMSKEDAIKRVKEEYGVETEIFVKDKAYYFPDILTGVKELPGNIAVYIKKDSFN